MEFRVWSSGASLRVLLYEPRSQFLETKRQLSPHSNQCNESEFFRLWPFGPHLEPPQCLGEVQSDCLFSTHYDILPWIYLLSPHTLTPLFWSGVFILQNLSTRNLRGFSYLRKFRRQGAVKLLNSTIKGHQRFWDYNNKLWRWSSESEAQEHLLEFYCTSLGVNFSKPKDNYLLTRINATNQNSLDFDHLDHTSNLPNALVRYKVTVFSLHTMTYSLGYTSYPHILLLPYFGQAFLFYKTYRLGT